MKIIDELYVGINHKRKIGDSYLAFVTPNGTDAAAKKRIDTVNNWLIDHWVEDDDKWEVKIVKNEPVTGFKVVDYNVRYVTDNKTIQVEDPRGWVIELYIPEFIDLILTSKVDNGVIDQPLVYVRDGAKNILVSVNSNKYDFLMKSYESKNKNGVIDHDVGDVVVSSQLGCSLIYLGKRLATWTSFIHDIIIYNRSSVFFPRYSYNELFRLSDKPIEFDDVRDRHVYLVMTPKKDILDDYNDNRNEYQKRCEEINMSGDMNLLDIEKSYVNDLPQLVFRNEKMKIDGVVGHCSEDFLNEIMNNENKFQNYSTSNFNVSHHASGDYWNVGTKSYDSVTRKPITDEYIIDKYAGKPDIVYVYTCKIKWS